MTRKLYSVVALAVIAVPLAATPVMAQMPKPRVASDCPAGTQYVPPSRGPAGNPVDAYCASAPTQGMNNPYSGGQTADPQGGPSSGGAGQQIAPAR